MAVTDTVQQCFHASAVSFQKCSKKSFKKTLKKRLLQRKTIIMMFLSRVPGCLGPSIINSFMLIDFYNVGRLQRETFQPYVLILD